MDQPKLLLECLVCKRRFRLSGPNDRLPPHPLDEYPEVECGGSGERGRLVESPNRL